MKHWTFLSAILVWVGLASCASPVSVGLDDPVRRPPAIAASSFTTSDDKELPIKKWEAKTPSAIVVGVHGMNDYSKTFAMMGPWLAERGVSTYAYDQRGFGGAPHPGLWAGMDALVSDAASFISSVKNQWPDKPLFVVGVSMGAAVSLVTLTREPALPVEGLVLVSPAVWGWSTLNPLYRAALWSVAHTTPSQSFTGSGLEIWPSDNIEMLRANFHDPLMIKSTRSDAIYGLVTLMEEAYQSGADIRVPTLLLYGARDEIIPVKPVRQISEDIADVRVAVYGNGYHMLLRDLQAEVVWQDILDWVKDPRSPLSSGADTSALTLR